MAHIENTMPTTLSSASDKRALKSGRNQRTAMPSSIGRRNDLPRTPATVAGSSVSNRSKCGPNNRSHKGTVTIASSELTTTSEMTYSSLPSRINLRGSIGAPAEIASTTSASSRPAGSCSNFTAANASRGTTTYIASSDRSMTPGRCRRYSRSLKRESRPTAKMSNATEPLSANNRYAVKPMYHPASDFGFGPTRPFSRTQASDRRMPSARSTAGA